LSSLARVDCGGLLPSGVVARDVFLAAENSANWVNRRVLSIRLREDGCTYERTSLDLVAPEELLGTSGDEKVTRQIVLPLTWWSKRADVHRVDFRGADGGALPLVHNEQQAALAVALMCSIAASELFTITSAAYGEICVQTGRLIVEPAEPARAATAALRQIWVEAGLSSECVTRVDRFVAQFVESFLVAVVVKVSAEARHVIVKYNMGHGMPMVVPTPEATGVAGALRERLLYRTRLAGHAWLVHPEIEVEDSDYRIAKTTHFEFEVTGDTLIRRLEAQLPGIAIPAGIERTQNVASLEVRPSIPNAGSPAGGPPGSSVVSWRIHVVPKKSALTNGARYLALFGFLTLAFFALISVVAWNHGISTGLLDRLTEWSVLWSQLPGSPDPTGAMQALTGVVALGSLFAGRAREHWVTSFVLRPFRWVAFFTGVNLSIVAVVVTPLPVQLWWLVLIPAMVVQGYVVNRSLTIAAYVGRRGRAVRP
jgi:hypothetical protein